MSFTKHLLFFFFCLLRHNFEVKLESIRFALREVARSSQIWATYVALTLYSAAPAVDPCAQCTTWNATPPPPVAVRNETIIFWQFIAGPQQKQSPCSFCILVPRTYSTLFIRAMRSFKRYLLQTWIKSRIGNFWQIGSGGPLGTAQGCELHLQPDHHNHWAWFGPRIIYYGGQCISVDNKHDHRRHGVTPVDHNTSDCSIRPS